MYKHRLHNVSDGAVYAALPVCHFLSINISDESQTCTNHQEEKKKELSFLQKLKGGTTREWGVNRVKFRLFGFIKIFLSGHLILLNVPFLQRALSHCTSLVFHLKLMKMYSANVQI